MRRLIPRPMRGTRGEGHSDADVWLRLFERSIAAGKGHAEATAIADAGAAAFRKRFATAPQPTSSPEPQASSLPK